MDEATRRDLRKIKSRKMKNGDHALETLRVAAEQLGADAKQVLEDRMLFYTARDSLILGKKLAHPLRLF